MKYTAVLSEQAKNSIEDIADYLVEEWSEKVSKKFLSDISKTIKQLETMPHMFPPSEIETAFRRCIVNKHTVLYYQIEENLIQILEIKGTRQNPSIN
jgi:plasmid stabilization system protein ParE